jgi:hypothetical protein
VNLLCILLSATGTDTTHDNTITATRALVIGDQMPYGTNNTKKQPTLTPHLYIQWLPLGGHFFFKVPLLEIGYFPARERERNAVLLFK